MTRITWPARAAVVLLSGGAVVGLIAGPGLAAGPSPGSDTAGDPYFPLQGNGGYDVAHYDLTLDYAPSSGQLAGTARISATATQALSRFDLDLRRDMTVTAVTVDGRPCTPSPPR